MANKTITTEAKTNEMTLDREAGALVSPSSVDAPIGSGALITAFGNQLKKMDNAMATEILGNSKDTIQDHIGFNVEFDNGATYRVEGNTSVGNNHMGEITQKVGTKSMLLVLLMSQNKITSENITADIIASLVNGEVGAMARVFDIDFDSEKFKEAEKLLKMIEQTTIGEVKGRQQASQVSITQE